MADPINVLVTGVTGTTNTPQTGFSIVLSNGSVLFSDGTSLDSSNITLSHIPNAPTLLSQFTNDLGNYGGFLTSANVEYVQFTGSISNTVMTVSAIQSNTAVFTGTINNGAAATGRLLTVTGVTSGRITPGQDLTGTGITAGTTVTNNELCSFTASISGTTLTVTGAPSPNLLRLNSTIFSRNSTGGPGNNVAAGTTITAFGTGTGGTGTYTVSVSQTVSSQSMTAYAVVGTGGTGVYIVDTTELVASTTITATTTGQLKPGTNVDGCPLTGTNVTSTTANVDSQLTGTAGSTGTYQVSNARVTATINNGSTLAGTIMTVTAVLDGVVEATQKISGTGVTVGTSITNQRTSTAPAVTTANYVSGGAVSATTIVLDNVTSVAVGQIVTGTGITGTVATKVTVVNPTTNTITLSAALTVQAAGVYTFLPAGGLGTYTVSASQLVASTTITGAFDVASGAMQVPKFVGSGTTGGGNNNHEWSQRYLNWDGQYWKILYINCNCNCNC